MGEPLGPRSPRRLTSPRRRRRRRSPGRPIGVLNMIMRTEFKSNEGLTKHSIYKVPPYIFNTNKTAYEPQVVSIGPYHHGKAQLKSMEAHKHRARDHRLERFNKTIDDYKMMLDAVVQDVMDSYEQLDDEWRDQNKFLDLMLLDGFFLLELLCSYFWLNDIEDFNDVTFSLLDDIIIVSDYDIKDPVFSFDGSVNILPYIVSDLLMVENQLPLLVLQKIIAVEWHTMEGEEHYTILNILVVRFFMPAMKPDPDIRDGLHMLDIVRKLIIFSPPANTSSQSSIDPPANTRSHLSSAIMPSFSDLFDVRVKLKRSETQSMRDITFSNGILSLPVFTVGGGAKSFYLNVLAFERLHHRAGHEVSSFVAFMYGLIKSEKDAHLLRSLEFVRSTLDSDKAIADLTQEIARDIYFDPYSPLGQVRDALYEYKIRKENENSLRKWSTRVREWRLAAAFLLVLTVIQTLYAVLAFHTNNK
ncbi:UPF0481 protein At3g47200-like [Tasmannia lanceolata]|uniref:UPF0481 protein At3g47200-like n=1 Tax=Tasmannia lanceolata TaxID=3420 RepID=UPI0040637B09